MACVVYANGEEFSHVSESRERTKSLESGMSGREPTSSPPVELTPQDSLSLKDGQSVRYSSMVTARSVQLLGQAGNER